jgi:hypothetical protein
MRVGFVLLLADDQADPDANLVPTCAIQGLPIPRVYRFATRDWADKVER